MPEHLKNAQNTKEYHKYLQGFMKRKEREHRRKVMKDVVSSLALMIAG